MEQITVATKLRIEHRLLIYIWPAIIVFVSLIGLLIYIKSGSIGLIYPLMACPYALRYFSDLPKQNIKAVVLDRQGITIQRHLLRDIYLPYEKLTYVWNYTFHFHGFDFDTNLFKNQPEIISAINHFRVQGLIKAPERKPILREFVSEWALLFVLIPIFSAAIIGLGFELFPATQWLARPMMFGAMIFTAAALLIRTIYRYWQRVSNHIPS